MSPPAGEKGPVSPWSCFHCRKRKLRCDRRSPCSHCSGGGHDCVFPTSGRMPTRRHDQVPSGSARDKQAEILNRLRRLERVVSELGAHVGDPSQAGDGDDAAAQNGHSGPFVKDFGRLVTSENGYTYIGNRFWGLMTDEVKSIREAAESASELEQEQEQTPPEQVELEGCNGGIPFLCGHYVSGNNQLQPLPHQLPFIWETFVHRVDPFIKVLHVPTTTKEIRRSNGYFGAMESGMTALMFAVSLAAVNSLSDLEAIQDFGETRDQLLARYTLGTEQALAKADVLRTTDIKVVQALAIYLDTLGLTRGTRASWSLVGLLARAAESMGLHRDNPYLSSLPPFEKEIRRRLWWHICFLDSRVGDCQVAEASISESIFDTPVPTNLNDADLRPDTATLPAARVGYTDLTLCLIQCDLWRLGRRIRSLMYKRICRESQETLSPGQTLAKARKEIKDKWLRHLDTRTPFHRLIEATVRASLVQYDLVLHYKGPSGDTCQGDGAAHTGYRPFVLALASMESRIAAEADPETGPWAWFDRSAVHWPTIATALLELRTLPWGPTCERAWVAVKTVCGAVPATALSEPMHRSTCTLLTEVARHRDQELERLRGLPAVSEQLRRLASLHGTGEPRAWGLSADRLGYDTAAAEEALRVEVAASAAGAACSQQETPETTVGADEAMESLEKIWNEIIGEPVERICCELGSLPVALG